MGQFNFNPPPLYFSFAILPLLLLTTRFLLFFPQTAEHLTLASLGKSPVEDPTPGNNGEKGDRGKSTFHEDESLPVEFRAKLQDYFRSGYDRGHMYGLPHSSPVCIASRRANTSTLFPC
jgi:endonuclease G